MSRCACVLFGVCVLTMAWAQAVPPAKTPEATPGQAGFASSPSAAGLKWSRVPLPQGVAAGNLNGVFFLDEKSGWIVGDNGLCLASQDGGKTWSAVKTGSAAQLRAVRFIDANTGWIVGDSDPAAPKSVGHVVFGTGRPMTASTILSTTDGGKTWARSWLNTNFEITAIATADGKRIQLGNSGGDAHADGDLLISTDGGKNFAGQRAYRALLDVLAVDKDKWVAAGSVVTMGFSPPPTDPLYTARAARIIYSHDGGKTWQVAKGSDGQRGQSLRRLAYRPGRPMLAVGDAACVLASDDNGATWSPIKTGLAGDINLRGVAWSNAKEPSAVIVGTKGAAALSPDGKSWQPSPTGVDAHLNCVSAVGDGFVAVGEKGMILRATRNVE